MTSHTSLLKLSYEGERHLLDDKVVDWALGILDRACSSRDIDLVNSPAQAGDLAHIAMSIGTDAVSDAGTPSLSPEAYVLAQDQDSISIRSGSARGLSYALTEMAAAIAAREFDFEASTEIEEAPSVPVRGIARAFSSVDEDSGWFHDRAFWSDYLDELACDRFNRFHLAFGMQFNFGTIDRRLVDNYLGFAYPFLLAVAGYDVHVEGVSQADRTRNLDALRFVARETKRRGLMFSLGLWTHAFAFPPPTRHRYPISGLNDENHADYCAAALAMLLDEIPEIDSLTFRVHFEAGIREATQEHFWERLFAVIGQAGRPIKVDLHAKGVGEALLAATRRHGIDVTLSGKYWAEHLGLPYHQTTIREKETARPVPAGETMSSIASYSRLFTRYGYADYLRENGETPFFFRMWPGTQKLLLWGDPAFASGYGRYSTFGGARGVEFCEPLFFKGRKGGHPDGRDPYVRDDLKLSGQEWRKYRYTYLLWGRLLYNPDASPDVWHRLLRSDYGDGALAVESGLAALSRILPLVSVVHGVSGANNLYWPEIYVDLPISSLLHSAHYDKNYEWDNSAPQNWGRVSPFDPAMFYPINVYASDLTAGSQGARYTPLEVAAWIDDMVARGETALRALEQTHGEDRAQLSRTAIDMAVLARLGRFFSGKLRAAVDYALFKQTTDRSAIEAAIAHLEKARQAFGEIVDVVDGVYQQDLVFGTEPSEHGHWSMRLEAMDEDLHMLRLERDASSFHPRHLFEQVSRATRRTRSLPDGLSHRPRPFERGETQTVRLSAPEAVETATLLVRQVDQSAKFVRVPMDRAGDSFTATIPAACTGAGFPVMYYFELQVAGQLPVIYPGFETTLANQPYFSIHSSAWMSAHGEP